MSRQPRLVTVNSMEDDRGLFTMEIEGLVGDVLIDRDTADYLFQQLATVLGKEDR